ncbi:hypothetical protein B0H63DRAFT_476570 [Podospora didyma]|uniref:Uncharacterized protein n=1 Tax=Podospora didyma TaxID=330526 RepID=A0AAE0TW80_9PEZI|nr:hypothetical protein B0H63DRAFT_476570 [Podospora didyma]
MASDDNAHLDLDHIRCYSLPYGAIGFVSHILTIWTAIWLFFDRSPWLPSRTNTRYHLDKFLAFAGIVASATTTVIVMVKCSRSSQWEYALIAACNTVWSCAFCLISATSAMHIHAQNVKKTPTKDVLITPEPRYGPPAGGAPLRIVHNQAMGIKYSNRGPLLAAGPPRCETRPRTIFSWVDGDDPRILARFRPFLAISLLGSIIGMVGLFSLVRREWSAIPAVRYLVLGLAVVGVLLFGAVFPCCFFVRRKWNRALAEYDMQEVPRRGPSTFRCILKDAFLGLFLVGTLALLFGDWILAAIAGNVVGAPDGINAALYWTYFVAKRLPFFSL